MAHTHSNEYCVDCDAAYRSYSCMAQGRSSGTQSNPSHEGRAKLESIHKLIHQPSYVVVYPETEIENGYQVAQRILTWHEQEIAEAIDSIKKELREHGQAHPDASFGEAIFYIAGIQARTKQEQPQKEEE